MCAKLREVLKLGIIIHKPDEVLDWEQAIYKSLKDIEDLSVAVIFIDGFSRSIEKGSTKKNYFKKKILKFHKLVERKISKFNIGSASNGGTSVAHYASNDISELDRFDYILNLNCHVNGGMLDKLISPRILEFRYFNENINSISNFGFYEITRNLPSIEIDFVSYAKETHQPYLLEKAYFTYHWSINKNTHNVLIDIIPFVKKSITNLLNEASVYPKAESEELSFENENISLTEIFKYCSSFWLNIFLKFFNILKLNILDHKQENWTLFVGENFSENISVRNTVKMTPDRNEFWADPFLYLYKDVYYVFFEKYNNNDKRGVISCGQLVNGEISNITEVLRLDYHLSYPNIFEIDNEIFMIPETSENLRVEIYKCVEFPVKWSLYSQGFEGCSIVDVNYYKDKNDDQWLFLNQALSGSSDNCSSLYIYRVDSLKLNLIEAHKQNPVLINSRLARNAGPIFHYNNDIIRPSQNNTYGIYGFNINFNKIIKLNINEYEEVPLLNLSKPFKELDKVHHFQSLGDKFIFDGEN